MTAMLPSPSQAAFLRHLVKHGRPWLVASPIEETTREPCGCKLCGGITVGRARAPTIHRPAQIERLDSGFSVQLATIRRCLVARWILPITGRFGSPGCHVVITPSGRSALAEHDPERGPTGWDSSDLYRLREERGALCLGPVEVEACERHPGEVEAYRWTWTRPTSPTLAAHLEAISDGTPQAVLACPRCAAPPPLLVSPAHLGASPL